MSSQFGDTVMSKVVGISYYRGLAEKMSLKRDPSNEVDENAIKVMDGNNVQVGFIEKTSAKKLAPFLDEFADDIEIEINPTSNTNHSWYITIAIEIWIANDSDKKDKVQKGLMLMK